MGQSPISKRSLTALWLTLTLLSALFFAPVAQAQEDQPDADGVVSSLEAVQRAVIQIEAVGSFVDPGEGMQQNAAGSGSGFIIDPAGIAVTNNHVVTGAAFLRVYVEGQDEPLSARVLGVSECADLAVIDLRGGDFPYLEWYDGRISVGLDVYAAGFPLGDPEFTLTRGIVAKARADGETPWASVNGVIQHDATINPGNSGGPLVDGDGRVVAVNFASNDSVSQYFAIGRDGALAIIDRLRQGEDVDSLGLNGQALLFDEETDDPFSGIWVASVESGSPADDAGLQAGDFVLSLEDVALAEDGTMASYCDILRSHDASDTLNVELYRSETDEFLGGQINGRALEVIDEAEAPLSQRENPDEPDDEADADEGVAYDEYVTITDDSERLTVDVPAVWDDIDGSVWTSDEVEIGVGLTASPDIEAFYDSFATPGLFFGARTDLADPDPEAYLDDIDLSESCTYDERFEYDDGVYSGFYDFWTDCGEEETLFIGLAALPQEGDFVDTLIYLEMIVATDADLDALEEIFDSFYLLAPDGSLGDLPQEDVEDEEPTDEDTLEEAEADSSGDSDADFVTVTDSLGMISVELPAAWTDLTISPWTYFSDVEEPVGLLVEASTNLEAFYDTWDTPGMLVAVSRSLVGQVSSEELLDNFDQSEECDYEGREPYEGALFSGFVDTWTNCLDANSSVIVYAGINEEKNYLALVPVQIVEEADRTDVEHALDSLSFGNPAVMEAFLRSGDEPELLIEGAAGDAETGDEQSSREEDEVGDAEAEDESTGDDTEVDEVDEVDEVEAGDALIGGTLVEELELDDYLYDYSFFPNVAVNAVLPSDFTDMLLEDWEIDGDSIGQIFTASSDVDAYDTGFETPGARLYASTSLYEADFMPEELLDIFDLADYCDEAERYDTEHELYGFAYVGIYDIWSGCGEDNGVAAVAAVRSTETPDGIDDHVVIMEYIGSSDADSEAFAVMLASYFHDPATAEAWATAAATAEEADDEAADDEAADDEATDDEATDDEATDDEAADDEAADDEANASSASSILAGIGGRRDTDNSADDEPADDAPAEEVDDETDSATDEAEESDAESESEGETETEDESATEGLVLALNLAEGGVYRASSITEQTVSQEILGEAQIIDQTIGLDYAYTVDSVDADGNLTVGVTYEAARFEQEGATGSVIYDSETSADVPAEAVGYAALVGSGFEIELAPNGQVLAIDGVDELMSSMLDDLDLPPGPESDVLRDTLESTFGEEALVAGLEQSLNFYPDGPVAVGDSWDAEQSLNVGFAFVANTTWTLVDRRDGLATIEVVSTIESDPDAEPLDLGVIQVEMSLAGEQSGELVIDEATGWVVQSRLVQELSGQMSGEGVELPMRIESVVTTLGSVEEE